VRPDYGRLKRDEKPRTNKPYALFIEALEATGKVAIGRVVMRSSESLVMLRMRNGYLIAQMLLWADSLREPVFEFEKEAPVVVISEAEREKAIELVDVMTSKFDLTRYEDKREVALVELVDSKRKPVIESTTNGGAQILDLTKKLEEAMSIRVG